MKRLGTLFLFAFVIGFAATPAMTATVSYEPTATYDRPDITGVAQDHSDCFKGEYMQQVADQDIGALAVIDLESGKIVELIGVTDTPRVDALSRITYGAVEKNPFEVSKYMAKAQIATPYYAARAGGWALGINQKKMAVGYGNYGGTPKAHGYVGVMAAGFKVDMAAHAAAGQLGQTLRI